MSRLLMPLMIFLLIPLFGVSQTSSIDWPRKIKVGEDTVIGITVDQMRQAYAGLLEKRLIERQSDYKSLLITSLREEISIQDEIIYSLDAELGLSGGIIDLMEENRSDLEMMLSDAENTIRKLRIKSWMTLGLGGAGVIATVLILK